MRSCTSPGSSALQQARAVDDARTRGEQPASTLAGVPLALKDILVQKGSPATAGSKILEGWMPPYNATVTQRLLDAGIVILGKTNLDEFAMGSSTENSAYGPSRNPWDLTRIPGGSGGGSAAALAAFEAPFAIGTDTGGLHPSTGVGHRHCRRQADLRRGLPVRRHRAGLVAGPGRSLRPQRTGHRAAARGDRRPRSARLHLHRSARAEGG